MRDVQLKIPVKVSMCQSRIFYDSKKKKKLIITYTSISLV